MPIQKSAVKHYLKLASLLSVQFIVIYGGAIWISEQRHDVHRIFFEWERTIPLVPSMIWVYFSVTPLMLLPAVLLDIEQLNRLAKQMMLAMLIAGVVFLIFPATIGYPPPENPPAVIELLRSIDRPYNLVPSLHVALSLIIMLNLHTAFDARGKALLGVWMTGLIASVILTHQHHLADVLGGLLLALLCQPLVPRHSRR